MGVKRAYWVWGLLAVGVLAFGLSLGGHWYVVASDLPDNGGNFFGGQQDEDIEDPQQQFHTSLFVDSHFMVEGGSGGVLDYENAPFITQALKVTQIFFVLGLVGLVIASVGLLFRARGIVDGKGIIASIAVLSLLFVAFSLVYFALTVPDAYDQQLTEFFGVSPELGFYTAGGENEDGFWQNLSSGPGLGWYAAIVGVLAMGAAFMFVYATDLKRARDILIDDATAAEQYALTTERRQHVLDRIRQGGNGE